MLLIDVMIFWTNPIQVFENACMVLYFAGNINILFYISIIAIFGLLVITYVHHMFSKIIGRLVTKDIRETSTKGS